jgi:cyclopropane fatty-acyl-phospholipid synthase-like methyltransferase
VLTRLRNMLTEKVAPVGPVIAPVLAKPLEPAPIGQAAPVLELSRTSWPLSRIRVAESLWGEGFIFPNGEEETLRLAKPLALSNAASLLLVGAGAGGPAFSVATQLGAWVSGFEADPMLATCAAERSARGGFGRRAEIKTWEPGEPNFSRRSYHHALALEPLRGAQMGAVLVSIFRALSPGGQLVLVDLVADTPLDPRDSAVAAWCRLEHRSTEMPSERAITGALARLGFDVRVAEDISLRHMQQALRGWRRAVHGMQANKPSPDLARVFVREAELWLRRISLMREHRIRLVRWHALRGTTPG